jgi:hypothetical protein
MERFRSMNPRSSTWTGRTEPRPGSWSTLAGGILLIASLLGATNSARAQDPAKTPQGTTAAPIPRMLSKLKTLPGTLRLPVIDGAVVNIGTRTVLLGGMTADFNATPAIQMRQPDGAWRPVGNQMLEARIAPRAIGLGDGRIFIWGGDSGSARGTLTVRNDGELLDPRIAGSAKKIDPPKGSDWQAPSAPCLLTDGTIALAAEQGVHRFDPKTGDWRAPIALPVPLVQPALCLLDGQRVLVITTGPAGDGARVLEVDCSSGTVETWSNQLPEPIPGAELHLLPGNRIVATTWLQPDGQRSRRTILLKATDRTIQSGPQLPTTDDATGWIASCVNGGDILMLASDASSTEDDLRAFLLRSQRGGNLRLWQLTTPPKGRRRMLCPRGDRSFELIGGYRYLSAREARQEGAPEGARLFSTTLELDYGTGPIGD